MDILFDDDHLLAVDKPAGIETVTPDGTPSLTRLLQRDTGHSTLAPCHRLDRDTTGILLFAKTEPARLAAEALFRDRTVRKAYLALTHGAPFNKQGTIRRALSEWKGGHKPVHVIKGRGGLEAETAYRILAQSDTPLPCALLLFLPHHGRTHQIRVHAAALGHPILGDDQYGHRPANRLAKDAADLRRQALHAWRIELPHPVTYAPLSLTAPLPEDIRALAAACGIDASQLAGTCAQTVFSKATTQSTRSNMPPGLRRKRRPPR